MIKSLFAKYRAKILSCPNKKSTSRANLIVGILSAYGASLSLINAFSGSIGGIICGVILFPICLDAFYSWWILRKAVKSNDKV